MKLSSTNPSEDYKSIGEVQASTPDEVKDKVTKAHTAKKAWRELGLEGRVKFIQELMQKLTKQKDEIAQLTAQEMGMPMVIVT
jgi:acyl-CoA reductase-like NAD-dependent aldehyde dehydrogenase